MNARKVIGVMLLSFGVMTSVSASYTDDLKQKYADGSFYIEYQVTRQEKNGEFANRQKPSMFSPMQSYDKYIYAQKGANKYYQRNDFVAGSAMTGKQPQYLLDTYQDYIIKLAQNDPLSEGKVYMWGYGNIVNNDVNVVKNGKIYALDRFNQTGYWTTVAEIAEKPALAQILCANMIIPTIFNSILFDEEHNKNITLVSEKPAHVMSEDLVCETYTMQKTNEYGSPIGELWYFQLYYKDGELKYFSDAVGEIYRKKAKTEHLKFLNKVNVLKTLEEDTIFDIVNYYDVQKLEVQ